MQEDFSFGIAFELGRARAGEKVAAGGRSTLNSINQAAGKAVEAAQNQVRSNPYIDTDAQRPPGHGCLCCQEFVLVLQVCGVVSRLVLFEHIYMPAVNFISYPCLKGKGRIEGFEL